MTQTLEIVEEVRSTEQRPPCYWHDCEADSVTTALFDCGHVAPYCEPHSARIAFSARMVGAIGCTECKVDVKIVAWL